MNWTTLADIKRQVLTLWDKGTLLAVTVNDTNCFPLRLTLRKPTSTEVVEQFGAVRQWIADLRESEIRGYRIVWREVNHRVIGQNSLPSELWIDSLDNALALIGKRAAADQFARLLLETQARCPELLAWLKRYPLKALDLVEVWPRLLDIIAWLRSHPRPNVYLRQVDISGVHSKFIEGFRGTLTDLLDLTLPPDAIQTGSGGVASFCRRYGFRDKPTRVRFRILDPSLPLLRGDDDQDITITQSAFAQLALPVRRVFITENEVNFLAFPPVAESMVIFGAGYGFDMLDEVTWLRHSNVYYWGDIDTHGFAILDQLRTHVPHAKSLLMDRETMFEHRQHWGKEPQPEERDLPRLNKIEATLYDDLRRDRIGQQLRLEQERIGFSWVERALETIVREAQTYS